MSEPQKHLLKWLAAALTVRLIIAFTVVGPESANWRILAERLRAGLNPYLTHLIDGGNPCNYPPLWVIIVKGLDWFSLATGLPLHGLVKLPAIAADAGIGLLIYHMTVRQGCSHQEAVRQSNRYLWNPLVIIFSCYHGQIESVFLAFILLTVLTIPDVQSSSRWFWSFFWLGTGIAIKHPPLVLLPFFLLHTGTLKQAILACVACALPFLLSLPFFSLEELNSFFRVVSHYSGIYGLWGYSSIIHNLSLNIPLPVIHVLDIWLQRAGPWIVVPGVMAVTWKCWCEHRPIFQSITIIWLAVFLMSSGFGIQYLLWVVPSAILTCDRWLKWYIPLATAFAFSLYYYWFYWDGTLFSSRFIQMIVYTLKTATWGLCLAWFILLWRRRPAAH